LIRILYTQNELSAGFSREEPVEQGRTNAADVKVTGWARSKS